MSLFKILFIWSLAFSVQAKTWSRLGVEFHASDELFSKNESFLLKTNSDISTHLISVMSSHLPQELRLILNLADLSFVFDQTHSTDALFMRPGFYKGFLKDELKDKSVIIINPAIIGEMSFLRLISHEFFHFIHSQLNPSELDWIKEGLAQYFEFLVHKNTTFTNIDSALTKSTSPLETDFNPSIVKPEKYGNSFLFFHYLFKNCGNKNDLWKFIFITSGTGRKTLEKYLLNHKEDQSLCSSPTKVMTSFVLAKMINTPTNKMSELTVLWDVDTSYATSVNVGESLSNLDSKTLKIFFEKLPSFLGLKMPVTSIKWMNENSLKELQNESIELHFLSEHFPPKLQMIRSFKEFKELSSGDLIMVKVR